MSLMGLALTVVIVSKQAANVTVGLATTFIMIVLLVAGLLVVHGESEVRRQETELPFDGIYVKTGLFVPVEIPLTYH